jgi:hypothetical protein
VKIQIVEQAASVFWIRLYREGDTDGGHSPIHVEYTGILAKKSKHRKVFIMEARNCSISLTQAEDGATSLSRLWKSLMQTLNKGKVLSEDNKVTSSYCGTSPHWSYKGLLCHFPALRLKKVGFS